MIFVIHLEAEFVGKAAGPLFKNDAMVTALLEGAQVDTAVVLSCDLEAERISIEGARRFQIGHRQHDMAQPNDVERRIQDTRRNRHCSSLSRPNAWNSVTIVRNRDVLRLHVEVEGIVSTIAADTRLLYSAK